MNAERLARAALSRGTEPGLHDHAVAIDRAGGPLAAHDQISSGFDVPGLGAEVCAHVREVDAERELEVAAAQGVRLVIPGDEEWPGQLDQLAHVEPFHRRGGAILGLWAKGPMRLDEIDPGVAIVGSRVATSYGREVAFDVAAESARAGFTVVSGAAFGIDVHAHRGALAANRPTVAVLACGLDRAYPVAHRDLLDHLARTCVVVSEVPIGSAPLRARFLARNRIVAGLARGTVVVEAAIRSGALNSASWTSALHRVLMAVPGPVTSALSEGTHWLMQEQSAAVVTRPSDVCSLLGRLGQHLPGSQRSAPRPRDLLPPGEQQVLEAVPRQKPATSASIARAALLAVADTEFHLRQLAGRGFILDVGSGWVQTAGAGSR